MNLLGLAKSCPWSRAHLAERVCQLRWSLTRLTQGEVCRGPFARVVNKASNKAIARG